MLLRPEMSPLKMPVGVRKPGSGPVMPVLKKPETSPLANEPGPGGVEEARTLAVK